MSEIDDLIDALQQQNFNQAKNHFDGLMGDKVADALDAEKINVASQIFNDADIEEEDLEELSDEEVEDILADEEGDIDDSDSEDDPNS